jgi:hypothetical protein
MLAQRAATIACDVCVLIQRTAGRFSISFVDHFNYFKAPDIARRNGAAVSFDKGVAGIDSLLGFRDLPTNQRALPRRATPDRDICLCFGKVEHTLLHHELNAYPRMLRMECVDQA